MVTVAAPIPRRGEPIARRNACASSGFWISVRYASASRTSVRSYSPSEPSTRCGIPACASARCSGSVAYPVRASARISAGWGAAGERVGDLAGDPVRLGELVRKRRDPHLAAGAAHRDQRLRGAPLVVAHAADGRLEDLRARAEVPPEHDLRPARVPLVEAEDVPRVGVPPRVDHLVVVAAHAQVPVRPGEQVDERRLRVAGVLELVGDDPPPPLPQPREPVRVLGEQPHRAREQVVELQRVAAPQLVLALAPHRGDQRRARMLWPSARSPSGVSSWFLAREISASTSALAGWP